MAQKQTFQWVWWWEECNALLYVSGSYRETKSNDTFGNMVWMAITWSGQINDFIFKDKIIYVKEVLDIVKIRSSLQSTTLFTLKSWEEEIIYKVIWSTKDMSKSFCVKELTFW